MNKQQLKEDFEKTVEERLQDMIADYTEFDCYYEDGELSEEEIAYLQNLQVVSVLLKEGD